MTNEQKKKFKQILKPIIMEVRKELNEVALDPKIWKNAKTEKKCSDLANHVFQEIYKFTRPMGQDNSAYGQLFMLERISEMINEQI